MRADVAAAGLSRRQIVIVKLGQVRRNPEASECILALLGGILIVFAVGGGKLGLQRRARLFEHGLVQRFV